MIKPKVAVHIEGGMIQTVLSSVPIDIVLYDYDTDGVEEYELTEIPQTIGEEGTEQAYVMAYDTPEVDISRVYQLFYATGRLTSISYDEAIRMLQIRFPVNNPSSFRKESKRQIAQYIAENFLMDKNADIKWHKGEQKFIIAEPSKDV